jgi:hypothetical protein
MRDLVSINDDHWIFPINQPASMSCPSVTIKIDRVISSWLAESFQFYRSCPCGPLFLLTGPVQLFTLHFQQMTI